VLSLESSPKNSPSGPTYSFPLPPERSLVSSFFPTLRYKSSGRRRFLLALVNLTTSPSSDVSLLASER
jgi:hypothetical protein